jgi:hypothetical protein
LKIASNPAAKEQCVFTAAGAIKSLPEKEIQGEYASEKNR